MTGHAHNTAELLSNDIILLTRVGDQDSRSIASLYRQVEIIAKKLRSQHKRVLLLSDCTREGTTKLSGYKAGNAVGRKLDFDKSATFGLSAVARAKRQYIISAEDTGHKVADFHTREEAEAWLLERRGWHRTEIGPHDYIEEPGQARSAKPKFLPQTWAVFKVDTGHAMGEIVSASRSGVSGGWKYDITNPVGEGIYSVPEEHITHILKGTDWVLVESASDVLD